MDFLNHCQNTVYGKVAEDVCLTSRANPLSQVSNVGQAVINTPQNSTDPLKYVS